MRNGGLEETQAGFNKGRGNINQISNMCGIINITRAPEKNFFFYFFFIVYIKGFDCVDQNKLWKILKVIGIPDHLTYLLENLYATQEATVRTGCKTTNCFKIRKGL